MRTFRIIRRKIEKSLTTRGLTETLRFTVTFVFRRLRDLTPQRRQTRSKDKSRAEEFDRRHGVDTGGIIPLSQLNVSVRSWIFGAAYQAVRADVDFEKILRELAVPCEQFTFVDLGSGKGRAILLAAQIPFQKIVGIELSEELNSIAQDNLRRWPSKAKRCKHVALVCMDAVEYEFPDGPLVLYMYNPFGQPVMEQVARNLRASYVRCPRRIVVIYFTPKHRDLWDGVEFMRRVVTHPGYCIYDSV